MCRMTIYKGLGLEQSILLSDLIVKPNHSIIQQSYNCQERFHDTGLPPQLNADGFGIGWYAEPLFTSTKATPKNPVSAPKTRTHRSVSMESAVVIPRNKEFETPCVFTSVTPAWNNRNLFQLADKVKSPLIFAHVRAASIGSPTTEANCHPFTFDKFLFMHNGGIADFHVIKRLLVNDLADFAFDMMQGNTDSEHCFALFLTVLDSITPIAGRISPSNMRVALVQTISKINNYCKLKQVIEPSLLNFAVSDGETLVATRYVTDPSISAASLYFSSGSKWIRSNQNPNEYIMQRQDNIERVFVLASERLSMDAADWLAVPKNHVVTVTQKMNIKLCPIKTSIKNPFPEDEHRG